MATISFLGMEMPLRWSAEPNTRTPRFTLSADSIKQYLEDVVVSTISLNLSTHNGIVEAKVGRQMYFFSAQEYFWGGYGSSLGAALVAYFMAFYAYERSG